MNPTPLLILLPYHNGDYELALNLVKWMAELSPNYRPHSILCVADNAVPMEKVQELQSITKLLFNYAKTMLVPVPQPTPEKMVWKPNEMFLAGARQVKAHYRLPFLWLEPDCVPLTPTWLDDLAEEYSECPTQYMGAIIHQEGQEGLPSDHLTGCSIYPNNAIDLIGKIDSIKNGSQAWDIGCAAQVVPRAMNTKSIHHYWGLKDMPPVFVEARKADDPKNFVTLSFIQPEAVLFHRCKDGSLMTVLRKKWRPEAEKVVAEPVEEEELPTGSLNVV